ncbi:O-antigen ligase family protein [Cobetia marina]|uniref:O-antigen ligase family protein n=1 Tax=Cobetia marina TaxID=28258 RepID=UPI0025479CD6|nr:O-antigen ligase family protein [Cobetia pacifica]MDI6004325.1 O-antigen ligase family protein [Cobetia pacifica]
MNYLLHQRGKNYCLNKYFLFGFLVSLSIISSDYIRYSLGIGIVDKIVIFLIFMCGVINLIQNSKRVKVTTGLLFIIFPIFIILLHSFYSLFFVSPMAVLYEMFRLFYGIVFFIYISGLSGIQADKFVAGVLYAAVSFLIINSTIIMAQFIVSPDIIKYFGMPSVLWTSNEKIGRWIGLFGNLPAYSITLVVLFILSTIMGFKKRSYYIFLAACIALSTSKTALIIFILVVIFLYFKPSLGKMLFITITTLAIGFMLYTDDSVANKIQQISNLILSISNFSSSSHTFYTLDNSIDWRFNNILTSINIFMNNGFGLGMGTWGDFSSTFNQKQLPSFIRPVDMADSYFAHLLAELGVISFIYIFLVVIIVRKAIPNTRIFCALTTVIIFSFLTTMGFSDSVWPLYFFITVAYLSSRNKNYALSE